jgi:hypothetical protein
VQIAGDGQQDPTRYSPLAQCEHNHGIALSCKKVGRERHVGSGCIRDLWLRLMRQHIQ